MDILILEKINKLKSLPLSEFSSLIELVIQQMSISNKIYKSDYDDYYEVCLGEFSEESDDLILYIPKFPGKSIFERLSASDDSYFYTIGIDENHEYVRTCIGSIQENYKLAYDFINLLFKAGFKGKISLNGDKRKEFEGTDLDKMNFSTFMNKVINSSPNRVG